ncbi:ubiquitin related modifier 1 [Basidiobolus meristosporus CBS 931.73]|uniref:Ubiquitin-related modifier 1 n=1 Tax=Basidiobolus meristosporus CBS 931.73 TaxID=1314790 RepID=A0A1Y1YY69_9FUNG|nr:ubiquitin related modifier 1 [Basidiobolus meristosporus CBS 931.73]|eukprot:ORY02978.1 ubiquitin related modifier 1 [Basidiobolus meristosporus CBS 931.73]
MSLKINLQFSGGMELLFNNEKEKVVEIGAVNAKGQPTNLEDLIAYIKENVLAERPELFVSGNTVRPGILVLVNDADWELEGELEYQLQNNDEIVFISTLHGG